MILADRLVGADAEPASGALELAGAEPVEELAVDHLGLRELARTRGSRTALDPARDRGGERDADPRERIGVE